MDEGEKYTELEDNTVENVTDVSSVRKATTSTQKNKNKNKKVENKKVENKKKPKPEPPRVKQRVPVFLAPPVKKETTSGNGTTLSRNNRVGETINKKVNRK